MFQLKDCTVIWLSVAVGQAGSKQCCFELPIVKKVGVCVYARRDLL